MKPLQITILVLILVLIAALLLMVTNRLDPLYFWALVIASAVFAYRVLPQFSR